MLVVAAVSATEMDSAEVAVSSRLGAPVVVATVVASTPQEAQVAAAGTVVVQAEVTESVEAVAAQCHQEEREAVVVAEA